MGQRIIRNVIPIVAVLALWPTAVTTVSAQDGDNASVGAVTGSRMSTDYHTAVASRGTLSSLADLPSMTQQAWPELQAIGQAEGSRRGELFRLASDASPSLTREQRNKIRSQLASSYLDHSEVLASLSAEEFCLLIDACWETGVSNPLIGEAIQARLGKTGYLQVNRADDIRVLLRAMKYLTSDEARRAKQQLVKHLWENQLTNPAYLREQDPWELFKLIQTTASHIAPQRGQQWAEFYMDYLFAGGEASASVGPVELLTAGRSLDVARKALDDQGYPQYTEALAKALVEGRHFGFKFTLDYRCLAAPIGTEETRQAIRDVLIDDDGLVRLEAAKILGWAYHAVGQLNGWQEYLDTEAAGSDGDAEALWLLARSHCEEVRSSRSAPLGGRRWVESALDRAESEETRMVCVLWLMERYENTRYYDQGAEFLESMEDQFQSAHSKRLLTALAVYLDREQVSNVMHNDRRKERETRHRLTSRIRSLQERLERAEGMDNQEYEVTKLQAMLSSLEQELAVLRR
jgi:hypothetical protein